MAFVTGSIVRGPSTGSVNASSTFTRRRFDGSVAFEIHVSSSIGGGSSLIYRMRGLDGTLSQTVFWDSSDVDSDATDYSGPGPVTEVAVFKIMGD